MRTLRLRAVEELTQVRRPGREPQSVCALTTASFRAALPTHALTEGGQVNWVDIWVVTRSRQSESGGDARSQVHCLLIMEVPQGRLTLAQVS